MKKSGLVTLAIAASLLMLGACHNSGKSSVHNADSANAARRDSGAVTLNNDDAKFMVNAANGGMTEIRLSEIAQQKSKNQRVKNFADMMVRDHTQADNKLKALANQKNITLPDSLSNDSQDKVKKLEKQGTKDFDKTYMKIMVDDHKSTVDDFQDELRDVKNPDLKQFVSTTLPTLQMHLDSAQAIDKMY